MQRHHPRGVGVPDGTAADYHQRGDDQACVGELRFDAIGAGGGGLELITRVSAMSEARWASSSALVGGATVCSSAEVALSLMCVTSLPR